jgi:hypothetical protein
VVDGKPVSVELQHARSGANVDAVVGRVTELMTDGLKDGKLLDSKCNDAVQRLAALATNPTALGEALSKLEQNGALATLLDTAPEDARKRLAASVQRSGHDRAKAALAKGVGGEVSKLMSGMITTDGDTK